MKVFLKEVKQLAHGYETSKLLKGKESEGAKSCPTPCDPMDCSLPGSSVHGIFQARILEWGAIDLNLALQLKRPESINWGTICPVLSF